jgi:GNAT superfamily N-acetyltransferase
MGVETLDIEQLPVELNAQFTALGWSDHDPPLDLALIRKARDLGHPFAEYVGLVAGENGQVLSQIVVERLRLRTDTGLEAFSGITGVITRPDAMGRGLSTRLFEEVHRREAAHGLRLALLWTHRSWRAHRLYERLGYRDIYSPPTALRRIDRAPRPRLRTGYTIRRAKRSDAPLLESLLTASTRGRWGFTRRYPGSFRVRFALGWRAPRDHYIVNYRARPVGYFYATGGRYHLSAFEGAAIASGHLPALLDALEREAAGRWLTFGLTTFVNDVAPLLRERGYLTSPGSHTTLMARGLDGAADRELRSLRRLVADPRFSCHRGDVF